MTYLSLDELQAPYVVVPGRVPVQADDVNGVGGCEKKIEKLLSLSLI